MMNQPPDHDFYNSSTEDAPFRPPQRPGYPQQPQSVPNPYATEQGPVSQPDSGSPDFPPAGPGPQNWRPGPQQQQDFPQQQQGFPPFQGPGPQGPGPGKSGSAWGAPPQPLPEPDGSSQARRPSFPPPTGPISKPGFSSLGRPQSDQALEQPAPWPGKNPPSPAQQQPNAFARQQSPGTPPWEQQQAPAASPWGAQQQPQPNLPAGWPEPAQPPAPEQPKKSAPWLVIILVVLVVLIVLGGGGYFLLARNSPSNTSAVNPPSTGGVTPTVSGATPVPTRATVVASTPTSGSTLNGVKTPVRAGNDWIVTITSVRETTSSFVAPNAGSTYLEINMTFKNISPKTLTLVSLVQFTLVDASGHRYNETAADTNIHVPPDGRVDAGQTLTAVFASEVPQKQHTFTLTFAYGLSDNSGATVAWRFSV